MLKEGKDNYRIPSGCAICGIFNKDGKRVSGTDIISAIEIMHARSNGLGGGFAGYGIYPEYKDYYAFHIFYDDDKAKVICEEYLNSHFTIAYLSRIPTRRHPKIINEPLIFRYFVLPKSSNLISAQLDEQEYTSSCVTRINSDIDGAYVFSSGKDMGVFKAVGYPEDVGSFYRLDEYEAYCWTAHGRYPTNTPGWWGGAHPFSFLDCSIVHNGEISSYDANRRYIEMFGYKCNLLTDTEVIAYILDFLIRKTGLSYEEAAIVIAAPFWSSIDRKEQQEKEKLIYLRNTFSSLLITGPFSIIVGFTGGIMALNDRLKLRSMVVGEKKDTVYIASEESAIRKICKDLDRIYSPRGGEPVIYTLKEGECNAD